jgi:hypothetical protein
MSILLKRKRKRLKWVLFGQPAPALISLHFGSSRSSGLNPLQPLSLSLQERLDLLAEKEIEEMEQLVVRKLEEKETRVLKWDPSCLGTSSSLEKQRINFLPVDCVKCKAIQRRVHGGNFWIVYAALNSFAFDAIYWKKIDPLFFKAAGNPSSIAYD